jgi:iron complex outermembrane receptor protein
MNLRVSLFAGAAALASLGLAQPAAAAAADTTATARSNTIEEVVITARKQAENLQKVPISVTAQNAVQLQQKRIVEGADLTRIVPSLWSPNSDFGDANSFRIALRGQVASDVGLGVGPAVGLYEDNVNIAHTVGSNSAFFDLDRVEVLRGPQGTLYGRNTTGGAVNIISRTADFEGAHGYIDGDFGNYQQVKISGAVNLPVVPDMLAVRVAFQRWSQDGYVRSRVTGQRFGNEHDDFFTRASIRFDPSSNFTMVLKGDYGIANRTASPQSARLVTNPVGNLNLASPSFNPIGVYTNQAVSSNYNLYAPLWLQGVLGNPAALAQVVAAGKAITDPCVGGSYFSNCEGTHSYDDFKYRHAVLDWKWDINDKVSLRSISGYHGFTVRHVYGFGSLQSQNLVVGLGSAGTGGLVPEGLQGVGGAPYALPFPLKDDEEDRFLSQEFNLTGKLLDDKLNWLVGAYGSWDKGHASSAHSSAPALIGALTGFFASGSFTAPGDPDIGMTDALSNTDKTYSLFTQEEYHFNDKVSLTLGGRVTKVRVGEVLSIWDYFNNADGGFSPGPSLITAKPADALGPAIAGPVPGLRYVCHGVAANGVTPVNYAPPVANNPDSCANSVYSSGPNNAFSTQRATGWSYLASLNFELSDDVLAYVKTARGFRGGAFGRSQQVPAKPETDTDYEVGLKGDFLEHRLRIDLAAYQTNYRNKQVILQTCSDGSAPPCAGGNTTTILRNAANLRIRGVELDWQAAPVEGLSLFGTASWTQPRYVKYPNALDTYGQPIGSGAGLNPGDVPTWQTDTGARYEFPVGPGVVAIQGDYSWRSKLPLNRLNNDYLQPLALNIASRKAVGLINGRIEYRDAPLGLTVAVWGTNLANKTWFLPGLVSGYDGVATVVTQSPREFGIELRKSFGGD